MESGWVQGSLSRSFLVQKVQGLAQNHMVVGGGLLCQAASGAILPACASPPPLPEPLVILGAFSYHLVSH